MIEIDPVALAEYGAGVGGTAGVFLGATIATYRKMFRPAPVVEQTNYNSLSSQIQDVSARVEHLEARVEGLPKAEAFGQLIVKVGEVAEKMAHLDGYIKGKQDA